MRNNAASNPVELQEMPRSGDWEESSQEQISSGRQRPRDFHPKNVVDHAGRGVWDRVTSYAFKYEMLAKKLERHHVTGIAFSAAVGVGLYQTSGEVIAIGGQGGALVAFFFASLVIFSVMRCLAEMVSVSPFQGALMKFPAVFVEPALGFAVGVMYWLANCVSMITLTISAATFTKYWDSHLHITSATFIILFVILLMNACGVELYGKLEWIFKWLKITLILALCILCIVIRAGGAPNLVKSDYDLARGYSPTGFSIVKRMPSTTDPVIPGTGGSILAVWTCLTIAMFQFMGGEMVIVTASEAKMPGKVLPTAARYMYLLPIGFYLVGIFLVGLVVDYRNPDLYHPHVPSGVRAARRSPFVIAIAEAGISVLPGFLNACFCFSALTAANSALYASSRTLFFMARNSDSTWIKETLGKTSSNQTPLAAIVFSFVLGGVAFLSAEYDSLLYSEPLHVLGRLYTGPILCVYASECLANLRFKQGLKYWSSDIESDPNFWIGKYQAHWQPLWAILGLLLCVLLIVFGGWNAVYDLCRGSAQVEARDSIVDLVLIYTGPVLFVGLYLGYKVKRGSEVTKYEEMRDQFGFDDEADDQEVHATRSRFRRCLSFLR